MGEIAQGHFCVRDKDKQPELGHVRGYGQPIVSYIRIPSIISALLVCLRLSRNTEILRYLRVGSFPSLPTAVCPLRFHL